MIKGISFWKPHYSGRFINLIAYHPPASHTWHWHIDLAKSEFRGIMNRCPVGWRKGQWHDLYRIPFTGWAIRISRQDYHRTKS